jgi:stage V sporulation protein AC
MTNKEYAQKAKKASPNSKVPLDCFNAFWVGGLICLLGQALGDFYKSSGLTEQEAGAAVSITLIGISIFLTTLALYDKIASFAGAGTLVPITGFANAMSSPAIEFKPEGHILGIGANMFKIAGPVIVYGVFASFVYGIILMIAKLF